MKKIKIHFSGQKHYECELEEEVANNIVDTYLKGLHKTIILSSGDKTTIIIVCNKIECIEITDI